MGKGFEKALFRQPLWALLFLGGVPGLEGFLGEIDIAAKRVAFGYQDEHMETICQRNHEQLPESV
jgi:hypothetical protein